MRLTAIPGIALLLMLPCPVLSQTTWKPSPNMGELTAANPGIELIDLLPPNLAKRIGAWDWLNEDEIVFAHWDWETGDIGVLKGFKAPSKAGISYRKYYSGSVREPLGIKVVEGAVHVAQKHSILKLVDADRNGIAESADTVARLHHTPESANHYSMDLKHKDGFLYTALPSATVAGGLVWYPVPRERGTVAKINLQSKAIEYLVWGLRTPDGLGWGPEGELFVTDNQGAWLPASKLIHVTKNRFFGLQPVEAGDPSLVESPPAIWMPYGEAANSPTQPMMLTKGPFAGQMIIGDNFYGNLHRAFLEKVNGEFQGALFHYTGGLTCGTHRLLEYANGDVLLGGLGSGNSNWAWKGINYGLQLMKYRAAPAFEVSEIRSRSNGFTLRFTKPVAAIAESPDHYRVRSWSYRPTKEYGGSKIGLQNLVVQKVTVDSSRTQVHLQIDGLAKSKVIHFAFHADLKSAANETLWTGESWYTLNSISSEASPFPVPISVRPTVASSPEMVFRNGSLVVRTGRQAWEWLKVHDGSGRLRVFRKIDGQGEIEIPCGSFAGGIHFISLKGVGLNYTGKIIIPSSQKPDRP